MSTHMSAIDILEFARHLTRYLLAHLHQNGHVAVRAPIVLPYPQIFAATSKLLSSTSSTGKFVFSAESALSS